MLLMKDENIYSGRLTSTVASCEVTQPVWMSVWLRFLGGYVFGYQSWLSGLRSMQGLGSDQWCVGRINSILLQLAHLDFVCVFV